MIWNDDLISKDWIFVHLWTADLVRDLDWLM